MQTFTFYASEDKLENRGNEAAKKHGVKGINDAACHLAREVAEEGDGLMAGGLSQTPTYLSGLGKEKTQKEFQNQVDVFVENKVDFLIAEYFEHIEEMEWAIDALKKFSNGLPVCASMCIGEFGDVHGVSAGECAVRMAKAGADVVGTNCHFGPVEAIKATRVMRKALDEAGIKIHMMTQPLAFQTPDAKTQGFIDLPEFPFGLEPRICTRFDIHTYAREAYNLGVRFIGGCCGFEPYHIRAIAQELQEERKIIPEGSLKHLPWGESLLLHTKPWVRARARRDYWENLKPASGRPYCPSLAEPDQWGVTAGDAALKQHAAPTTEKESGSLETYKQ